MASLQRFRLNGIRDTGRRVGDGAYATVLEYDFRGLTCVGKKMHRLLYEEASQAQRADLLRRFEEECQLLSQLHHPNIVQFLGVHVEPGSVPPVLVMEYLPTGNLSGYLDRHGVQPDDISYGILRDVALGLRYLHEQSPPIIHRDLSANNVLLTSSLLAKISDLGVAKILDLSSSPMSQHTSTKAPGIPCYMPPEALMARPNYTIKIDSYAFGVLVLHVLSGEWPFPTSIFQSKPEVEGGVIAVTEVDRRAKYLEKIGRDHPLSDLIRQCLSNVAHQRPEAIHLLQQINTVMARVVAPPETVIQQLESTRRENQRLRGQNESFTGQNESLIEEVHRLRGETQSLGAVIETVRADVATLTTANEQLNSDNQQLRREKQSLRRHVQEQPSSSGAAVRQPLRQQVERLSVHNTVQDGATARRPQPLVSI